MTLKMTTKWMVILGIVLLAAQVSGQETKGLRTQTEKVSYGIGVEMARDLQRQGIYVDLTRPPKPEGTQIDLDLLIKGLKDALSGQRLLIPENQLRRILIMYQGELRRRQVRTRTVPTEVNRQEGEAFLAANKTKGGVVTLPSGLQYKILKAGEGRKPTDEDTVECHYRGTLIDGTEFDFTEPGKPSVIKVSELIPGWKEALKLMPVGSKWQLFIPPRLAYDERGTDLIGPNETLILEVELVAIK